MAVARCQYGDWLECEPVAVVLTGRLDAGPSRSGQFRTAARRAWLRRKRWGASVVTAKAGRATLR
jgi:hypothetical protein